MKTEKKELNNGQIELTIHVTKAEAMPWLTHAAQHLSQHRQIKGFRPGKAPYDVVKREFGEAAIIEEAMEDIINGSFNNALEQENLLTYGRIGFDLLPVLNPDDIAAYKAVVTRMPEVKLGDWQNKKIKRGAAKVEDADLTKAIDEMAGMLTNEAVVDRPAEMNDKVMIDFEVSVDGKPIEGGSAKDFGLILGEKKMIPGFEEQLVGKKASEKVEFKLSFPADYHAKDLSGKEATFKISVNQVLARIKPNIDDSMAKRLGVENLEGLKTKLSENILKEKQEVEEEKVEIAAIKQLVEASKFEEIPQAMIDDTAQDLVHDFEHTLSHQGMKMDQYLSSIGKTVDGIKKEFEPKAMERIKSSMALGQLAEDEKISITQEEIESELERQKKIYAHQPQALNDLGQPEYRRHIANTLINRKLIEFVKSKIVE